MIRYRTALTILAALLLTACGGEEHSDIKQWMANATQGLRGKVPPLPEVMPFPVVSYDASDVIDPFKAARIEPDKRQGGGGNAPNFDRRKEELERFPLDAMKFVGLIRNDRTLFAVIVADKRIYRVKVGNYLGQDFGRIADIQASPGMDEGRIILREQVREPSGDWVERETVLEMQSQQGQEGK